MPTTFRASRRTALVTGANQNLGRSLVAGLAAGLAPTDRVDPHRSSPRPRRRRCGPRSGGDSSRGRVDRAEVLDVRDPEAIRGTRGRSR